MPSPKPSVDILLATYNCARFGPALLDSLLAQTHGDFRLIVRDDGSKDESLALLESYRPRFGGRMTILEDRTPSGSATGNFARLLAASEADHILFADHDDVWLPEKVADTLALLSEAEAVAGPGVPAYVFTDVRVVDAALAPVAESYWAFKRIDPAIARSLSHLLVCPPMLGCASGLNRALVERLLPMPVDAITGHDWYALLVACIYGHTAWSPKPGLLYRLHGANVSAQAEVTVSRLARIEGKVQAVRHRMARRRAQAAALLERFDDLPAEARDVIARFVATGEQGFLARRLTLLRGRYLFPDLTRNAGMLALG
ncbi:MAG: glycosyltransferase [Pseudomonadota bacterium]